MKNYIKLFVLSFLLLSGMNLLYAAAGNRVGTGGASQLLIPVGVRGISMADAGVATARGVEALFWNPAGAARMDNSASVLFSHMNYIADIGVEYGAVSANFNGFGILSLSIKSLSIGEIDVTTEANPDGTGETFTPQMLIAGISYSRMLSDRIAVGLTANFLTETLGDVSASGVAFNIGVVYDNLGEIDGLSFGIVMKNLGPQMKYDGSGLLRQATVDDFNRPPGFYRVDAAGFELPSSFEFGVGYRPTINEVNTLQFSGTFQNNNFSGDEYKLGMEYGYDNLLFVRGGYTTSPKSQTDEYIYGLTAGVGINYDLSGTNVKVDYAFRDVDFFDSNHVFSLSVGF